MYLGELRALTQARARGFNGAEILDVLGIEVDGVDIAAGVGEARVLQAVDELAQALIRLGEGQPAARARSVAHAGDAGATVAGAGLGPARGRAEDAGRHRARRPGLAARSARDQ